MRELEVDFPEKEFRDALFQAVPVPIVVVDKDLEIWEYNAAAARCITNERGQRKRPLLGPALRCVHAQEASGCGQGGRCADCTLFWAVRAATEGQSIVRQWARMEVEKCGSKLVLQVSSAPVVFGQYCLALVMLEGLAE